MHRHGTAVRDDAHHAAVTITPTCIVLSIPENAVISDSPAFFYTLLDSEHFEPLSRYRPSPEYASIVGALLSEDWTMRSSGFWTQCTPERHTFLAHGWKIHVSAVPSSAAATLNAVVPILVRRKVPFKFCSDERMLELGLNKNWPRTGAGKFITIYPGSEPEFIELAEVCYDATTGFSGPYILSDRPYRDSRVVFYRYGEHSTAAVVTPDGQRASVIIGPDSQRISDARQAYFALPPWVTDPFTRDVLPSAPGEDGVLLHERYQVTSAERFSSIGGIYGGVDTHTGLKVIIREARPHMGTTRTGYDPRGILEKEARILQRLGPTGYTAAFVDFFQEWDHWFLVQERLEAESLWGYAINFTHGPVEERSPARIFDRIRTTIKKIVAGLETVHAHGVVLRDLTKSNVMFTFTSDEVRFIDLELSFEMDRSEPLVAGWTTGYASRRQLESKRPVAADDYFALGALIVDMVAFTAAGLPLNRRGTLAGMAMILADHGLPEVLLDIAKGLLEEDPGKRWTGAQVLAALDGAAMPSSVAPLPELPEVEPFHEPSDALVSEIRATVAGIVRHMDAAATPDRDDRLWPASGEVFATNPVSVQFGAAGTAHFLWRATGAVPTAAVGWILRHWRTRLAPPGLYVGLGGVAVTLWDFGYEAESIAILEAARGIEVMDPTPGLYYGSAGWGLANLHTWVKGGHEPGLEAALAVARQLADSACGDSCEAWWDQQGGAPLGLGHGASGIATFLTYLGMATGDDEWIALARRGLNFEIRHKQENASRLIWFSTVNARASGPKSPHMRHGTAGVGSAILRYARATGDASMRDFAEVCAHSVTSRFTNKLWHDYGLSGYGEFLLDMYQAYGDERYRNHAFNLAQALLVHRMDREGGHAFPGSELLRISCDFGMGSAGIGVFLFRLLNPTTPRYLMLDELFEQPPRSGAPARESTARHTFSGGHTRVRGELVPA